MRHDLPISLWVGRRIIGELPQEARSRFWFVLLQQPQLAAQLGVREGGHVADVYGC